MAHPVASAEPPPSPRHPFVCGQAASWSALLGAALLADLSAQPRASTRALLRLSYLAVGKWVELEGRAHLEAVREPALFVLNHNNSYECVALPAILLAARQGRMVSFFIDWMYLETPFVGSVLRHVDPIPVYTKRARWGLWEHRRAAGRMVSTVDLALARLAAGDSLAIFPEGTRNRDPQRLGPPRSGLAPLILRSNAPVVPIGLEFPAARRLGRSPKLGRLIVRVGAPLDFAAERAAFARAEGPAGAPHGEQAAGVLATVMNQLAALSGKRLPDERNPIGARTP
jgi:1-acyl-sn-glycerol-3-phosphate acyltransferase